MPKFITLPNGTQVPIMPTAPVTEPAPEEQVVEVTEPEESVEESEARPRSPSRVDATVEGAGRAAEGVLSYVGDKLEPEEPVNDLSDLFTGPQPDDNDIDSSDLTEITDEDEDDMFGVDEEDISGNAPGESMDDLFNVSREDVMGHVRKPKYRIIPRGRRVIIRRPPPGTSMGGLR